MSFEGYVMSLCAKGHLLEEPFDYAGDDHSVSCPRCGAGFVWDYRVDETNDSGVAPVLALLSGGEGDEDATYYLPSNAGQIDLSGLDHRINPEIKPVRFMDRDHPDDGPFRTERAALENKANYWLRARKQDVKEARLEAKRARRSRR
jgi:hypothetical protein